MSHLTVCNFPDFNDSSTQFEEFDIDVEFLNLLFLQWVFLEGRNFQLTLPKPLCLSDHGMAFLMMFMSLESLLCTLASNQKFFFVLHNAASGPFRITIFSAQVDRD